MASLQNLLKGPTVGFHLGSFLESRGCFKLPFYVQFQFGMHQVKEEGMVLVA